MWSAEEYARLPAYDNETFAQPPRVFMCHQGNGHLCGGWAGCHDMKNNLGLRFVCELMSDEDLEATLDFTTDVPLFASGTEAAAHGVAEIKAPSDKAIRTIEKLIRKRGGG